MLEFEKTGNFWILKSNKVPPIAPATHPIREILSKPLLKIYFHDDLQIVLGLANESLLFSMYVLKI